MESSSPIATGANVAASAVFNRDPKSLSLIQKVSNIVSHFFTVTIPSFFSMIVNYFFTVKPALSYSPLGREALIFARNELAKHPEIEANEKFMGQPIAPELSKLKKLWVEVYKEFESLLKEQGDNAWTSQAVLDKADTLMKIAFATSNLTLDSIPAFSKTLPPPQTRLVRSQSKHRTYAETLCTQDSYPFRLFFDCTQAYHWLRGALHYKQNPSFYEAKFGFFDHANPKAVPEQHAASFYLEGTLQNSWNKLYNEYCARVRKYVSEAELQKQDPRFVNWTKKDTPGTLFMPIPDTMPT